MLQDYRIPTLKELIKRLPPVRDIPSLSDQQARESLIEARKEAPQFDSDSGEATTK